MRPNEKIIVAVASLNQPVPPPSRFKAGILLVIEVVSLLASLCRSLCWDNRRIKQRPKPAKFYKLLANVLSLWVSANALAAITLAPKITQPKENLVENSKIEQLLPRTQPRWMLIAQTFPTTSFLLHAPLSPHPAA
jgi:hypothetical protein